MPGYPGACILTVEGLMWDARLLVFDTLVDRQPVEFARANMMWLCIHAQSINDSGAIVLGNLKIMQHGSGLSNKQCIAIIKCGHHQWQTAFIHVSWSRKCLIILMECRWEYTAYLTFLIVLSMMASRFLTFLWCRDRHPSDREAWLRVLICGMVILGGDHHILCLKLLSPIRHSKSEPRRHSVVSWKQPNHWMIECSPTN